MNTLIFTGFTLGLLSSFHCLGMCGPIALSLPVHQYAEWKKNVGVILYNLGRVFTYIVLGFISGFIGQSFYFAHFQQYFSIIVGCIILLFILNNYLQWNFSLNNKFYHKMMQSIRNKLGILMKERKVQHLFAIGILNGILPCGMVYLALAAAATSGELFKAAFFMLAFGLGTIPLMYSFVFLGKFIGNSYRLIIQKSVPLLLSIMAVLLIFRGLNLGIPFLSPQIEIAQQRIDSTEKNAQIINCHVPRKR